MQNNYSGKSYETGVYVSKQDFTFTNKLWGILKKLSSREGVSEDEIVQKAIQAYYCCLDDVKDGKIVFDPKYTVEIEKTEKGG